MSGRQLNYVVGSQGLQPARQEQDDEDEHQKPGAASHIMIARMEAVTASGKKEDEKNDDEEIHNVCWVAIQGSGRDPGAAVGCSPAFLAPAVDDAVKARTDGCLGRAPGRLFKLIIC